jgi:hypothetical protein
MVSSENSSGADNQQETVRSMFDLDPRWVVGFVDGEGCFSVSIHHNPNARSTGGWQLHPVFHVYQHVRVPRSARSTDPGVRLWPAPAQGTEQQRVDVRRRLAAGSRGTCRALLRAASLVVKEQDFLRFADIVGAMRRKDHLRPEGFERLVRLADAMNADGKQRVAASTRS